MEHALIFGILCFMTLYIAKVRPIQGAKCPCTCSREVVQRTTTIHSLLCCWTRRRQMRTGVLPDPSTGPPAGDSR